MGPKGANCYICMTDGKIDIFSKKTVRVKLARTVVKILRAQTAIIDPMGRHC